MFTSALASKYTFALALTSKTTGLGLGLGLDLVHAVLEPIPATVKESTVRGIELLSNCFTRINQRQAICCVTNAHIVCVHCRKHCIPFPILTVALNYLQ